MNTQDTTVKPTAPTAAPAAPVALPIAGDAFKKAVQWAAQNPDAPQAAELQSRIVSGKYNDTIKSLGLDPVQFGYKAPPEKTFASGNGPDSALADNPEAAAERAKTAIFPKVQPFLEKIGGKATEETAKGFMEAYNKLKEDLSAGTVAGGIHAVADVANGVFSPFAAAFNAVTGGAVPAAVDATGESLAAIPGMSSVLNKFNDYFDQHPDVKRTVLEDLPTFLNVAAAFSGGAAKPSEIVPEAMTKAAQTAVDATAAGAKKAVTGAAEMATTAMDKGLGAAETVADTASAIAKPVTSALKDRAVSALETDYEKWTGATKAGVKKLGKAGEKTEAMNAAGTSGNTPQRILAESGIIPETQGTKFSTFSQAKAFREALQPLNEANEAALKEVDMSAPPTKINQLESETINAIRSVKKPAGEIESMVNEARKEFGLLREKYGDTINASEMNAQKKSYSQGVNFDGNKPLQGDVYYQIRKALQKNVEDTATAAGHEDVAQLNREIGDRLSAADMLQSLDGQTLKYGKLGKYAFMGIGASIGHGILGKVFGALAGEQLASLLMKADVAGPVKRLVLKTIEAKSPEAYQATLDWMKQQGLDRDIRLALPPGGEGTTIPSVIEAPAAGTFEKEQQIRDSKAKIQP